MVFKLVGKIMIHQQSLLLNQVPMGIREILLIVCQLRLSLKIFHFVLLLQIIIVPLSEFQHRFLLQMLWLFFLSFHSFNNCLNSFLLNFKLAIFFILFFRCLFSHLVLVESESVSIFLIKLHLFSKSMAELSLNKSSKMGVRDSSLGLFDCLVKILSFLFISIKTLIK